MDPKNRRLYTGRCGELAVMAELQPRGCTAVIPEVDVGKDLFVLRGKWQRATRVQVKTGNGSPRKTEGNYSVQVKVPLEQLKTPGELYYVFAIRLRRRWTDFIVISRGQLNTLRLNDVGAEYLDKSDGKRYLKLTFSFRTNSVTCSKQSFQGYRNAWHLLPPLAPHEIAGGIPAEEAAPDTGQPLRSAGQLAAMSELLDRGCNVAIPEVDRILAFQDEEPGVTEIQVLTCKGVAGKEEVRYTAQVHVPLEQLKLPSDLYYVFAIRAKEAWSDFIIISREQLDSLRVKDVGTEYVKEDDGKEYLTLTFTFSKDDVRTSGESFQAYRNVWTILPPLRTSVS